MERGQETVWIVDSWIVRTVVLLGASAGQGLWLPCGAAWGGGRYGFLWPWCPCGGWGLESCRKGSVLLVVLAVRPREGQGWAAGLVSEGQEAVRLRSEVAPFSSFKKF